MNSYQPKRPARRRTPVLEGLERREVLSFLGASAKVVPFSSLAAAAAQANASVSSTTNTPQPTPQQLRRERYVAKFVGTYAVGLPRYTDQTATISVSGSGGSNQSLRAVLQMVYFTPADSTSGTISGVAAVLPRNIATTGSLLALNITGASQPTEHGLPTHFTWTVSTNSGGIYLAAGDPSLGFGTGEGTLDVQFMPSTKANRAGKVIVTIQGLINGSGVGNDIAGPGNSPKHP